MRKSRLFFYKLQTWFGLVGLLIFGILMTAMTAFAGMFVMYMIVMYVQQRSAGLQRLKWQYYEGLAGEIRAEADRALQKGQNTLLSWLTEDVYGGDRRFLCRTCQAPYDPNDVAYINQCVNLRNVFPHDPKAEPPSNNPFRWYWFTVNGYPMPPAGWDDTKPWLPGTATSRTPSRDMAVEGFNYYRTHSNPLWDAGYGIIPEWYVTKTPKQAA